jgi:hypothetical protein
VGLGVGVQVTVGSGGLVVGELVVDGVVAGEVMVGELVVGDAVGAGALVVGVVGVVGAGLAGGEVPVSGEVGVGGASVVVADAVAVGSVVWSSNAGGIPTVAAGRFIPTSGRPPAEAGTFGRELCPLSYAAARASTNSTYSTEGL